MGILSNINFNVPPSSTTSLDFRLLDTPCDHLIRNEAVEFNVNELASSTPIMPFSGSSTIYSNFGYSAQIDPDAFVYIQTKYPYINAGSLVLYQTIDTSLSNPINQVFTVSNSLTDVYTLEFPPKTNSVSAKQKIYVNSTDYNLVDFARYTLSQLYGKIEFTNIDDAGSEIVFTYLADKKQINPADIVTNIINYELLPPGTTDPTPAIVKIYGRALSSSKSKLIFRYGTTSKSCLKCYGQNALNDIYFDYNGRIQTVYDFSKMLQDFFKRLLTIKGSNPFDPNEGTSVTAYIGMAKSDGFTLSDLIKSDIVSLIYTIRDKQNLQGGLNQGISLAEQIAQVNDISVRAISPTDMEIVVDVTSKSGVIQQITAKVGI